MVIISQTKKYRAKCATCSKTYNWRDTEEEAESDADEHQDKYPDHVVNIETKTTTHSSVKHE